MERKKVNNIKEIWNGIRLKTKDFSNMDLEGLDLSKIPKRAWKGCIFYNTNLRNTGIKFKLNRLDLGLCEKTDINHNYIIENCDFSENDLKRTFKNLKKYNIEFDSCNFTDTNISDYIYGKNNVLDKSCSEYIYSSKHSIIDAKTLINNPNLDVDLTMLLRIIEDVQSNENSKDGVDIFKRILEHKDAVELKKLYNILIKYMEELEVLYWFANREVNFKHFDEFSFGDIDPEILEKIRFQNCRFDKLILDCDACTLFSEDAPYYRILYTNFINELVLTNLKYNSWNEANIRNRLTGSITFRTNLYLELGRICNAKCEFCRNSYYCDNKYNLESIKNTLSETIPKLDSIVIGGGEPTLLINDLKNLINDSCKQIYWNDVNLHLFTNGSCKYIDDELSSLPLRVNYNISRHAVDDDENSKIFGLDKDKLMSTSELENFIGRTDNTTLAATCFKGGLDSFEKIVDYINYAKNIGCQSILFSDLMVMEDELLKTKESYNFNIEDCVFEDVMFYLQKQGFERSLPICATGGYILTILKKDDINISFKHYISKKELEENWPIAIKRTFDLSIDPNGNLYENWHQTSGIVKNIKKK